MDLAFRDRDVLDRPIADDHEPADADDRDRRAGRARRSSASSRARRCSCSTAATRSACSTRSDVLVVPRRARTMTVSTRPMHDDGFETRAIHAGQEPDPATGAVVPPISLATTFAQDAVGKHRGYEYARSGNPTRDALETCVASLEGARHGLAFASGLAAEDAILRTLDPGDHVIIPTDAYGGTFRLVARVHERHGLAWTAADLDDPDALDGGVARRDPAGVDRDADQPGAVDRRHRRESPSSRTQRNARVVVDNTFATPFLQQPLALGADVVVHSSTKYLGGHSDVVGGFVADRTTPSSPTRCGSCRTRWARCRRRSTATSCCAASRRSRSAWSATARTRARSCRCCASTRRSARVLYPGLPEHPGHDVARRQMRDFGGMVSFLAAGGEDAALDVVARTRLFTLAESLGAVESLIEHPGAHDARVGGRARRSRSIPRSVRLSVGIEAADDLVADLAQALDTVV